MAQQTKTTLKNWFLRGMKPLSSQFADWMDSYWHKEETIPSSKIEGLQGLFDAKAESSSVLQITTRVTDVEGDIDTIYERLDFDSTPTTGSENAVTSDGIKDAIDTNRSEVESLVDERFTALFTTLSDSIDAKQDILSFDETPTTGSSNPVRSGGVKTALEEKAAAAALTNHIENTTVHITAADRSTWNAKQNALTFDDSPTANSSNPVKSSGIKTALDAKEDSNSPFEINSDNFSSHARIEENEHRYTLYDIPVNATVVVLTDTRIRTAGIIKIVGASSFQNGKIIKLLNPGDSMTIGTAESEGYSSTEGIIHGFGGLNLNTYSFGKFRFIEFVYWNGGWYSPVYNYSTT